MLSWYIFLTHESFIDIPLLFIGFNMGNFEFKILTDIRVVWYKELKIMKRYVTSVCSLQTCAYADQQTKIVTSDMCSLRHLLYTLVNHGVISKLYEVLCWFCRQDVKRVKTQHGVPTLCSSHELAILSRAWDDSVLSWTEKMFLKSNSSINRLADKLLLVLQWLLLYYIFLRIFFTSKEYVDETSCKYPLSNSTMSEKNCRVKLA